MMGRIGKIVRKGLWWLWQGTRALLFVAFAVISSVGIFHAATAQGSVHDREAELVRLQEQLLEQQMRGEELSSRLGAFRQRGDVREQAIRSELGMLRDNEKFYIFK